MLRIQRSIDSFSSDVASDLIRNLVLDDNSKLIEQLENASWVWPHKITVAAELDDAVHLCRYLTPSAILVAVDSGKANETGSIPALRRRLPTVPIIAVVSQKQLVTPGKFLDQGAAALLMREYAHRPTLHDLLVSVQPNPDTVMIATQAHVPALALPWCRSEMLGALTCDITASIIDANDLLATWLGYSRASELRGRNVLRNLLTDGDDWIMWTQVAGDTSAIFRQRTSIATRDNQILWMQIEVFAAPNHPNHPNHLQAVLINQTELALLTSPEC